MKPPGPRLSVVPEPGDDDPEIERYLSAARERPEPDAQTRARLARALNAALPPSAPLPAFGSSGLSSAARGAGAVRLAMPWLALGAALIGGLGFGVGVFVGRDEPERSARVVSSALEPNLAAVAPPASSSPSTAPTPASDDLASGDAPTANDAPTPSDAAARQTGDTSVRAATDTRGTPAKRTREASSVPRAARGSSTRLEPQHEMASSLRREASARAKPAEPTRPATLGFREALEQLRRAREQLEHGHAMASLLLLSELDRDAGLLLFEEREATRVLALCAAGRTAAARAAADRLAQSSPRSIYARRLASSCIASEASDDREGATPEPTHDVP